MGVMGATSIRELRIPQSEMIYIHREELQDKLKEAGFDSDKPVTAYFDFIDLEFVYQQDSK